MIASTRFALFLFVTLCAASAGSLGAQEYEAATHGTRIFSARQGGLTIKMLVEESNLGSSEVEVGEITFPAGSDAATGHNHGAIEMFYVLSGTLVHVVDGVEHTLTPGMMGIVRPGHSVIHRVPGDQPVKALVIWAPGGEAERLARFFEQAPVGESGN